jgi:hypothetical protein
VLGPVDYVLWFAGLVFPAAALVCAACGRALVRYLTLNLYLFASLLLSLGRLFVFLRYGFTSHEYFYFYYYSDAFLTVCLYLALMGLYKHVFDEMGVSRYLRVGALLLLAGTALFSYQVVINSSHKMLTRFVVELSQNLYFVGVVLTYVLWGVVLKMHETRARLIHLVLGLGVYFSAFAANYAMRNLYPQFSMVWMYVPPLMAIWLPASWAYTFWRIPEEARLAPSRVATAHR